MENFFDNLINLENLEKISNIGLFLVALLGLYQIYLFKKDIKIRSLRESIDLTLKQVEFYRIIIEKLANLYGKLGTQNTLVTISKIKSLNNYTLEDLKEENLIDIYQNKLNLIYKIDSNLFNEFTFIANSIESFSIAFISKAANEEIAYSSVSDTFCQFVEEHYEIYCFFRKENNKRYYKNTIELYKIWKTRLLNEESEYKLFLLNKEMSKEKNKIDKENSKPIIPIGTN